MDPLRWGGRETRPPILFTTPYAEAVVLAWMVSILFVLHLFSVLDWGWGRVRGILLCVLLAVGLAPYFLGRYYVLRLGRGYWVWLVLLALIAWQLSIGLESARKTSRTNVIPMDQGQNSYRAVRLLGLGINPYGWCTLLDPGEYWGAIQRHRACLVDPSDVNRAKFDEYCEASIPGRCQRSIRRSKKTRSVELHGPRSKDWVSNTDRFYWSPTILS